MNKLVIFGIGDLAGLLYYYLNNDSNYEVVAFCVDKQYLNSKIFNNLPVYALEDIDNYYNASEVKFILALGYSSMRFREIVYDKIVKLGFELINYISSKAIVAENVKLGFNNIILQGVVLEPNVEIGNNNIIWSSSIICHDVKIGNHNFIAAGSICGGFSHVKNLCFIGFNSTIIDNIIVENETLIGAKSLLIKNTDSHTKWFGSPAQKVGSHKDFGIKIK